MVIDYGGVISKLLYIIGGHLNSTKNAILPYVHIWDVDKVKRVITQEIMKSMFLKIESES